MRIRFGLGALMIVILLASVFLTLPSPVTATVLAVAMVLTAVYLAAQERRR